MLRLIGALSLILIGASLGAQMCSGSASPPPPAGAYAVAPSPQNGEEIPQPQPLTPEEKRAELKIEAEQRRSAAFEDGWLRLDGIDFDASATRARISFFAARGDLFFVDLNGTTLVAGPANSRAIGASFPELASERLWQGIYFEQLRSSPVGRVPEGVVTSYSVTFPPVDRSALPERVFVKLRYWKPSERARRNSIVLAADGGRTMEHGEVASVSLDLPANDAHTTDLVHEHQDRRNK